MRDDELNKAYFQYYETFEDVIEKIRDIEEREHLRKVIIRYGLYGEEPRRETNAQNRATEKPAPKMKRPTIEEIAAYCKEKGYKINAQHFFNYYESNGWRVGKNPMKSWQAALTSWNAREKSAGTAWSHGSSDSDTSDYEKIL